MTKDVFVRQCQEQGCTMEGIWSCQDQHAETQIVFAPRFAQGGDV